MELQTERSARGRSLFWSLGRQGSLQFAFPGLQASFRIQKLDGHTRSPSRVGRNLPFLHRHVAVALRPVRKRSFERGGLAALHRAAAPQHFEVRD